MDGREVQIERWSSRAFYVTSCPFRVDLPLDMSGCVAGALHESQRAGHRRIAGGLVLASDARRGGAIFVEVEPGADDASIVVVDADVLARRLPPSKPALRNEVDELLRWSGELGHAIAAFYVGFTAGERPRSFHASRLFAALESTAVVEPFEVRSRKQYVARALF